MTNYEGKVVGIEHIKELAEKAAKNVTKNFQTELESGKIQVIHGDGRQGLPEEGPYDCIHVGAASQKIPGRLVEQLKIGGIMVIPIGQEEETQELHV